MIANPAPALRARLRSRGIKVQREFQDRKAPAKAVLKALRLHQWAKNILIFVPMLLAHVLRAGVFADAAIAFVSFSLCASSTYIANDLLDIESDRRHPRKRNRPFAAGDLSVLTGVIDRPQRFSPAPSRLRSPFFPAGSCCGCCFTWWERCRIRWS